MEKLKDLFADLGKMAIDYKLPDFEPMKLDYHQIRLPDIEVPPNPIYETNELLTEQNDLLRKQLEALQKQNEELMQQAEDSTREARASRVFGWISFGIGTAIAIITLIVG